MERGKNNLATSEREVDTLDTRVVEKRRKLWSFPWLPAWFKMKTTCRPPKRPTRNQNHNPLFFCIFLYALVREIRQKTNQNSIKPRNDVLMTSNSFALPVKKSTKFCTGDGGGGGGEWKAPPQGPTPYPFIYHFWHKRVILLLTNGIFHIPNLEFCILLSAVLNMNE